MGLMRFIIWLGFIGRSIGSVATALESRIPDFEETKAKADKYKPKILDNEPEILGSEAPVEDRKHNYIP